MSFDVWAKKSGAFLPAGLVAVAAYFQAAGIGQLVGAHLVPNGVSAVAHASTVDGPIEVPGKDAAPILARNPFDSTTGPLDGKTVAVSDLKPPPAPTASGDPYLDAPCAGVTSSMVTAAEDPARACCAVEATRSGARRWSTSASWGPRRRTTFPASG